MPCFITGSAWGDRELESAERLQKAQEATRLLCAVMKALDNDEPIPTDVKEWWDSHKKIDQES